MLLLLSSVILGLLLPGGAVVQNNLDVFLLAFKLTWLIPIPLLVLYYLAMFSLTPKDLTIDPLLLTSHKAKLASTRILYTIVSRGINVGSVEKSVSSVVYWTDRVSKDYGLPFTHEVWIVTEEDAYAKQRERYDKIVRSGVRLIVVPADYQTKNRTKFKARALQYAVEYRLRVGFDTSNDWVYHQDEETNVGQDTILGNLDFIVNSNDARNFGPGIILYPQIWHNNIPSAAEFWRSSLYDLLYLHSIKKVSNTATGYHGSHLMTRADVENELGWDYGQNTLTEDSIYAARILRLKPQSMGVMKGFAYEQPPFTISDLLKQRRRWILGASEVLKRNDVRRRDKLPILGGLVFWYSALPALLAFIIGLLRLNVGLFPGVGCLLGVLGYSILDVYKTGYDLNRPYIANSSIFARIKLTGNCLLGLTLDCLAPWYAMVRRTNTYEVIRKDAKEA